MKIATAKLSSVSPYSQSRHHDMPKKDKERPDDYDERTWREHCHAGDDGQVYIPPMVFKNCLDEAAKFLAISIPGKGKATWTKHFEAGVLVIEPMPLGIAKADLVAERVFVDSNGRRNSGTRVWRKYPIVPKWAGTVTFHIIDNILTETIFAQHLREAGSLIGIGRFRPRNRGFYGRFKVDSVSWQDLTTSAA